MNKKYTKPLLFALLIGLSNVSHATNNEKRVNADAKSNKTSQRPNTAKLDIYATLSSWIHLHDDRSDRFLDLGAPATLGLLWLGFMGLRLKRNKL